MIQDFKNPMIFSAVITSFFISNIRIFFIENTPLELMYDWKMIPVFTLGYLTIPLYIRTIIEGRALEEKAQVFFREEINHLYGHYDSIISHHRHQLTNMKRELKDASTVLKVTCAYIFIGGMLSTALETRTIPTVFVMILNCLLHACVVYGIGWMLIFNPVEKFKEVHELLRSKRRSQQMRQLSSSKIAEEAEKFMSELRSK